jgi:hypothetical protein
VEAERKEFSEEMEKIVNKWISASTASSAQGTFVVQA